VPHFDNAEGGKYDTSRCYLGERRLALLESELPEGVATLGVDEHTVLVIDLEGETVRVLGKSHGYWRLGGEQRVLANGSLTPLSELRQTTPVQSRATPAHLESPPIDEPSSLGAAAASGGSGAIDAIARLVRLAESGGSGFIDPAPLVNGVLAARTHARSTGQYGLADELRDALVSAGIDVQDGPEGTTWSITGSS
jgi:hypothetical protein